MSKLAAYAEQIGKAIEDVSELNVRTFSGDLNTIIDGSTGDLTSNGLDSMLLAGTATAKLKLEALTVMKIDGDIDQFISSNIQDKMKQIHDDAVVTGKETRSTIIEFVKSFT